MPQAGRLPRGVLCLLAAAAGAPTSAQPANAPMLAVPLDPIAAILEALRLGRMALTPPPPDAPDPVAHLKQCCEAVSLGIVHTIPDESDKWMKTGRIESINTSRGGVPKMGVFEALVTEQGLDGDRQRDRRFHGGPDRAVILFSLELIRALQREGHPIAIGTTGENLTMSGMDWAVVAPGSELEVGDVRLRITKYASPCENIADSFLGGDFTRISQKAHAGWSRVCARVLIGGLVRIGDPITAHAARPT